MREIHNPRLSQLTTLRLGGVAVAELIIEREEDLFALPERIKTLGVRPCWLGRGSNLLARDGQLPLALARIAIEDPPKIISQNGDKIQVSVGAGIPLPRLLGFCLQNSLAGLQGLCGIPGSVGGAVAMNAGSFGQETADCLTELTVWTGNALKMYKISELEATYRNLSFPDANKQHLIVKAIFTLTRIKKRDIFNQMFHNFLEKKFKQPLTAHSAGCVYKNPAGGMTAGMALDQAGMKEKRIGGMAFSGKHANFLINTGSGTADQALELLELAEEAVKNKFGIILDKEIKIIP